MVKRKAAVAFGRRFMKRRRTTYVARFRRALVGNSGELKFLDVALSESPPLPGGSIHGTGTVNVIPQGDGQSERIGRKVTVKSLHLNGNLRLLSTAFDAATSDVCRLLVYVDHQCNGATADPGDILATANYNSQRNLENGGRFSILLDKFWALSIPSGSGSAGGNQFGQVVRQMKWHKECNVVLEFDSTAATGVIATIRTNNIGVLTITRAGDIRWSGILRVRFCE